MLPGKGYRLKAAIIGVITGTVSTTAWSFHATSLSRHRRQCPSTSTSVSLALFLRRDPADEEEYENDQPSRIPQLPAFGSSSNNVGPGVDLNTVRPSAEIGNADAAFVTRKFKLQYTCNICETRNSHMVSRLAYREGVVVAICKGCKNKHLIADNLNATPGTGSGYNIEKYFKAQGMEDSVNRVTPEVFNLESVLSFDTSSGSLVGDDGNPVLE